MTTAIGSTAGPRRTPYAFDNNRAEATDQHGCLSAILDPITATHMSRVDLTGKRCLELGAGGGSIAVWLAEQVGESGSVTATDINPVHIPAHPRLTVLRHDLQTDDLPAGAWDVIHERLVTVHLPARRDILRRMAAALAPGGLLLVEEWLTTVRRGVLDAPSDRAADLYRRYHDTLVEQILVPHGSDPAWAEQVPAAMRAQGLQVEVAVSAQSWAGGSAGALLAASNAAHLRQEFLAAGWTAAELDELVEVMHDPRMLILGNYCYSTIGRRPPA